VYGGRLSPHPSGSVPVQIHLSNCLRIADSLCTAGGSRRTLPAMCRFKSAGIVPVQIRLSNCLHIADSLCTAGGSRRTLPALCRFKFAFQTVCVSPTACVRRAALAAPFRHCAGSNSPFKPLVHIYTSSDGERLRRPLLTFYLSFLLT